VGYGDSTRICYKLHEGFQLIFYRYILKALIYSTGLAEKMSCYRQYGLETYYVSSTYGMGVKRIPSMTIQKYMPSKKWHLQEPNFLNNNNIAGHQ